MRYIRQQDEEVLTTTKKGLENVDESKVDKEELMKSIDKKLTDQEIITK